MGKAKKTAKERAISGYRLKISNRNEKIMMIRLGANKLIGTLQEEIDKIAFLLDALERDSEN